ncbi:sensor histidine kinase [Paenibacillus mesotrionivorans]|uniref:Sensor histidine kinase n=1 Tax=Paenibacillus mesotrionivorans TaxID=3160968 RepID=A0ACC7NU15_9BACL
MFKAHIQKLSLSIFPKIIMMFLLLLLPLYTAGLLVNQKGENNVRREIAGSVQARVQYFNRSLEREIERMVQLQQQYVNDKNLLDLSVSSSILSDFQKSQAINALYDNLLLLKSSSPYVQSVSVHLSTMGKTITTQGYVLPLEEEKFDFLKLSASQSSGPLIIWSNRLFLRSVYPDRVYDAGQSRNPLYILEIELSSSEVKEELEHILEPNNGAVLLQNDSWVLTSSTAPELAEELQQYANGSGRVEREMYTTSVESLRLTRGDFLIAQASSPLLGTRLMIAMPEREIFGPLQTYRQMFWVLLLVSIVVVVIFALWIFRYIHRPLVRLMKVFRQMENGNLEMEIFHRAKDEFHTLYTQFNTMVRKLKAAIDELYEQKLHTQKAELKQLQSNIHPHFLYNTFYIIYRMAKVEDLDSVRKLARLLGDYFRFISRNAGDEVPLLLEVEHARNYMDIQAFRFGNRIKMSFGEIPPGCGHIQVPKLILQPLIENAFHYGLEHKGQEGRLEVEMELRQGVLVLSVHDNGTAPEAAALEAWNKRLDHREPLLEITGTMNVHRRLRMKFGPDSGMEIYRNEWGGVSVRLLIPVDEWKKGEHDVPDSGRG